MNQRIDLIYFLSSLVMVAGPLTVFTWLTWLVVKAYRNRQRESHDPR